MDGNVTITKERYAKLLSAEFKLDKLEAYGVDNWCGYCDAMCDSEGIFEDTEEE